jgi:hypothetical protein
MISGNKESRIAMYIFLDPKGEGYPWVKPESGEELWGIPYGFHTENSMSFIEHWKNGVLIKTVNTADISLIEFMVEK